MNDLWTIPGEESLLEQFHAEDRTRFQAIDPVTEYHARQIREFLQAIGVGRKPLVSGEDGRAVVEMFTAIYESNKTKRQVKLPITG